MTLLLALALLLRQDPDNKVPDPEKINRAIDRGTEILLQSVDVDAGNPMLRCDELVLFALVHAGKAGDPRTKKLLERILKADMNAAYYPTYNVSLRAMALAQFDPVKYQLQIAQCAWWLVQAQTDNGQWDYWSLKEKPPASFPKVPWPGKQATGEKTKAEMGLLVKRTAKWADRPPGATTKILRNASTAQYAILGLYAAHRSKVWIPVETWDRTLKSVLSGQQKGGGWGYIHPEDKANDWTAALMPVNRSMTASQLAGDRLRDGPRVQVPRGGPDPEAGGGAEGADGGRRGHDGGVLALLAVQRGAGGDPVGARADRGQVVVRAGGERAPAPAE
jgi:hypothetical protein